MLFLLVMGKNGCGHFQQVSLLISFTNPLAPVLVNFVDRTASYIKLAFGKVNEDKNQLVYKVDGADGGTFVCTVSNQKCDVNGLSPGKVYNLAVNACIADDPSRCGASSRTLTVSTLPNGMYPLVCACFVKHKK